MAKIQRNDIVMVISGREKGKLARVVRVLTDKQRVMLEDHRGSKLRTVKKHRKPNPQTGAQGRIEELRPTVHISNVMLLDANEKTTRVGYQVGTDGKKSRVARTTGANIVATAK